MLLQPIRWFFWLLGRFLMACRYRYHIVGKEKVLAQPGPYLVLPNHPAFIDPPNILAHLWPMFQFRPMLLESNFNNPVLAPFGWLLKAIKVPDLEKAVSAEAKQKAENAVQEAVKALQAGENVVLWPSGHLMRDGLERIGGARAVAEILAAVPNTTVVLVRTRGLWGSMFSWAQALRPTNERPRMPGVLNLLLNGILLLFWNLILFAPRRHVTLTLEPFPTGARPEPRRELINPWMQSWYNADLDGQPEPPKWVPYHLFIGKRTHTYPPPPSATVLDLHAVKPATKLAVAEMIAEKLKRPLDETESKPTTTFMDLGIDSLDAMDIMMQVEQRFGFSGANVPVNIGQLWALAEGQVEGSSAKPVPETWFQSPSDSGPIVVPGDTVPSAFVNRVFLHPKDIAAADDIAGVLTYERLLIGARIMAKRFHAMPEPNIGLLMPASVAGDLALLGLHLAGKLPVILNWTTGPNNLAHAVTLMGLKHVITSRAFIDRTRTEVPGAEFVFLEDIRKSVGKIELLRLLLGQRWFPGAAKNAALKHANTDPQKPAVVLFTSGSEKAPKAVPLTHANVIGNMLGCIPALNVDRSHSVLGFLPLFHSFGHTVTGLFPLLGGVRVVHHPDPTDASGLRRKIAGYKPTLLATTPTFLGFILDRAQPGELDSLKLIVVGAEKCPDIIFEKARKLAPKAVVIEGYGITECSPVVSVNPPHKAKHGTIGQALPGMELSIRDLDTHAPLPQGKMGMLHVHGPNVFPGYIGEGATNPFFEADGKHWYVTGDLAALDEEGYVLFHGRLKRFLKAGGEMISLPALEEPFAKKFPPTDAGPRVAVEGIETPTGRLVVLFTTEEISVRDANATLQAEGFRGVMRLDEVRKVPTIPVLGTGKTDYKVLRAMLTG